MITGRSQMCFHTSIHRHPKNKSLKYKAVSSSLSKFLMQFSSSDLCFIASKYRLSDFTLIFDSGRADIVLFLKSILACLGELCKGSLLVQLPLLATSGLTGDGESFSGVDSCSVESEVSPVTSGGFCKALLLSLVIALYTASTNEASGSEIIILKWKSEKLH